MALPLQRGADDTPGDIIQALAAARGRPDAALGRAAPHAAAIAPAVIELVTKAADGVHLIPSQGNLLFWGVHVLAAARRTELCQPLLRLVRSQDHDYLDDLFGDAITETFKRVVISVFDGDTDALVAAIADRNVESFLRWELIGVLARLTFDGVIARATTAEFLDRFEREALADPGDPAWEGWQVAVVLLGLEELYERCRQAWREGRMPEDISDLDFWETNMAIVRAMRPGDPALFDREGLMPITDPVEALRWAPTDAELAERRSPAPESPFGPDPAAGIALDGSEKYRLAGFLDSKHAPATAMNIEQVDGYFCALAVCPSAVTPDQYLPALWNHDLEIEAAPAFDSEDQANYVADLLRRHMQSITQRLEFGYPYRPILGGTYHEDESDGIDWAGGFIRGIVPRAEKWGSRTRDDEDAKNLMKAIFTLATNATEDGEEVFTPQLRSAFLNRLPLMLLDLHHRWRGMVSPLYRLEGRRPSGQKIGRNEPCPCGSGKKFKRCCGGAGTPSVH